ncbi:Protein kinase-like domain protein [Metarhizium album ARSEF 1941]|uniref:Protein kinase-like domain protein n=1 Tax=Metarhizium album (strain ARSEF 1941) TaxID=1081103 RepID=A0A0B2WNU1_METAS|nr:Protein kinase-like domain protein [Metarhizium album ARSEF 1941]KHN94665.1 Protein kinase-like domain protein [Metarhizium album ARSEF 1941]
MWLPIKSPADASTRTPGQSLPKPRLRIKPASAAVGCRSGPPSPPALTCFCLAGPYKAPRSPALEPLEASRPSPTGVSGAAAAAGPARQVGPSTAVKLQSRLARSPIAAFISRHFSNAPWPFSSRLRQQPLLMAAEHRPETASEGVSEERTEPFSQSEIDARFNRFGVEDAGAGPHDETVSLDDLHVEDHHHRQGIRILVRPLTKSSGTRPMNPGSDNCRWLALRAEVASSDQPEHKVLAVTQTSKDIKFSVRIPGDNQDDASRPPLWCELYYDPASDKVIFLNKSDVPISLHKLSQTTTGSPPPDESYIINPIFMNALRPGTWRIKVREIAVLDFRILEKRPVTLYQARTALPRQPSSLADLGRTPSTKRALSPDEGDRRAKRRISDASSEADDGVIMFLRPAADPLVFPLPNGRERKELSAATGHALLDADKGDTIAVPSVCEVDEYYLTKRDPIASTALSAVYTADYSNAPDKIVTVKVLKTRVANAGDKPFVHERNIIRQADMWLRESQSQESLQHESIVRYYGGDARYLSLYMEHIDAPDLTAPNRWRNKQTDFFTGTRHDAMRILRDIAGALGYIHDRQLVHNDVKPGNILYSPERGAVLCDFGLSTPAANSPSSGGTPYYVPPEFIGTNMRGPASDVWALGITMLYALREISFPDSRAGRQHPRPLYWLISGVNNPGAPHKHGNGRPAASQMRAWLEEIFEARGRLNPADRLERLVKDMLTPNPNHRITMDKVWQELLIDDAPAKAG